MSTRYEKMSVFEQLQSGLEDSIAFSNDQISLNTTELLAPRSRIATNSKKGRHAASVASRKKKRRAHS